MLENNSTLSKEEQELEDTKIIEHLKLSLVVPPYDDINKSNIIAIRHGFTEQNRDELAFIKKYGGRLEQDPKWRELMLNAQYIDTPLHSIGIKQCIANRKQINEIDFEVVLVSPLKRAIQTNLLMFAEHPNRSNIKFIIFPLISEGLCGASCIGYQTTTTLRQKMTADAQNLGITLDYSLIDSKEKPYTWQFEQIANQEWHQKYLDLESTLQSEQDCLDYLVTEFNKLYPAYIESWQSILDRSFVARKQIKELIKQYPDIESNKRKIGLVTHGFYTRSISTDKLGENNQANGFDLLNCQICPLNF